MPAVIRMKTESSISSLKLWKKYWDLILAHAVENNFMSLFFPTIFSSPEYN